MVYGKFGKTEDIVNLVLFFSELSNYIEKVIILVNIGLLSTQNTYIAYDNIK